MEGVGNQAGDQVVLGNLGIQGLIVGHVKGDAVAFFTPSERVLAKARVLQAMVWSASCT
jgi:hypothetical protein